MLKTIARNVLSTWFGYVTMLLIGFLLAPFIVHHLGNTGYGVWTLIVSLTGYFGLLDLGLRQSVGRFVSRHVALEDGDSVRRTLSTAVAMLGSASLCGFVITLLITVFFDRTFKVEPQFAHAARVALMIAGINVSVALPMSVFSTILMSHERFDIMSGITVAGAITRATLVMVLLNHGYGVVALALVAFLVSTCEYTTTILVAKRLYPPLAISWSGVSMATCKELFNFGIYRFVWIIANQLIFYTDTVVIGIFLTTGAITYYAIAGSLINYGRNIASLATDTLYPAASRFDATHDFARLRELLILGTQIGLFIAIPLCSGYVFLGGQFIHLWMGNGYALSATILAVLTIPQIVSMSQCASSIILVGMSRHKILAKVALAEGVANIVLSIILAKKIGLIGVAVGTVIPHLITTTVVVPVYTLRTLNLSFREYAVKAYAGPLFCGIPTAALCWAFSVLIHQPPLAVFIGEALAVCAVFGGLTYFVCLSPSQRTFVMARLARLTGRARIEIRPEGVVDEIRP